MKRVEIIAIGREILNGQTLDTNSNWLAKRITALGGIVGRICIPDDDVKAIVQEIKTSFGNGTEVIITTGGLGPTFDDKTLAGIAEATERPLTLDPDALAFVTKRYQEFYEQEFVEDPAITPPREKMAHVPEGSELLDNSVGTAPAVFLKAPQGVIFALPGVPKEMHAIFEQSVLPRLTEILGPQAYQEEVVNTGLGDESVIAGIVDQVMKQVPGTYLKSKATQFGAGMELEVIITAASPEEGEVNERVQEAKRLLLELIKVRPTHTGG
ncbi:MAG: competence/damage-inducible protein A [Deltaproteobacteria bacterium]|nr:competence/damage-inducible protein A [Deltaproteobacteria bacterium]